MRLPAIIDRPPFDSPWVHEMVAKLWLPVWFAVLSALGTAAALRDQIVWFFDARLYLEATKAWLAGGDPWAVNIAGFYFAAPPPTLLPLAPVALLPIDVGVLLVAAAVVAGAVATVRMLRLPWWWILFPPLVHSVLSANVQALLIPLIVGGGGALAVLLKVYAGLPLLILGRWRSLVIAAVVVLLSVPILPWASFIEQLSVIAERLTEQTNYALPTWLLVVLAPVALLAMSVVGRDNAAWLAVPALWPSQQYYYGTLAMGTRRSLVVALVAMPVNGSGLIALLALGLLAWREGHRPMWARGRDSFAPARSGPNQA